MVNKRERNLIVLIAGIAGIYGLFLAVRGLFLGPLDAQAAQIRSITGEIANKQKQMDEILNASSKLAEWEKLSLPGDEGVAQALYQDYLFRLMRDCNFEDPQVSADKTQRAKSFASIPFTIRGRVSLENLTQFLYRFQACEPRVMHQVRSLTVSRPDKGNNLSVTISVAAMSLDSAPDRAPLIEEGEDPRKLAIEDVPLEKFASISKKNIFEPFRDSAPPKAPEKPEVDAPRFVVYSGWTRSGEGPEGWVYDRLNNENKLVRAGDELTLGGLKIKIVSVAVSHIELEMEGKRWSLKLGKNLRELKEIGSIVAQTENLDAAGPSEPEKVPETAPAESAPSDPADQSGENSDKIGRTLPAAKALAAPEPKATTVVGGS